ncbi:DUF805 domain-containing protein [Vibrio mediterranei]|uniref:DUF805 domain-containing protein n=1 Tax=Vibrio mediterranei TaxID=689 RepID=UPI004068BFD9
MIILKPSFKGERITRLPFFLTGLVWGIVLVALIWAGFLLGASTMMHSTGIGALVGVAIAIIFFGGLLIYSTLISLTLYLGRAKDIGIHPAWFLTIFIPYIGFLVWLLAVIVPSDAARKYNEKEPIEHEVSE